MFVFKLIIFYMIYNRQNDVILTTFMIILKSITNMVKHVWQIHETVLWQVESQTHIYQRKSGINMTHDYHFTQTIFVMLINFIIEYITRVDPDSLSRRQTGVYYEYWSRNSKSGLYCLGERGSVCNISHICYSLNILSISLFPVTANLKVLSDRKKSLWGVHSYFCYIRT